MQCMYNIHVCVDKTTAIEQHISIVITSILRKDSHKYSRLVITIYDYFNHCNPTVMYICSPNRYI